MKTSSKTRRAIHGVGIGLRTFHYEDILEKNPQVPWFEVLADNYLVGDSSLLNVLDEIVERWIVYLGCTREIEDLNESYVIAFDPDIDSFFNLTDASITTAGDEIIKEPPRFLHLNQTLQEFGLPVNGKLIMATSFHTFPGRPNEAGRMFQWTVDQTKQQVDNQPSTHQYQYQDDW